MGFVSLALAMAVLQAGPGGASPLPITHAEFMSSCLKGGGSAGHRTGLGSSTILQRNTARHAEVSILTTESATTTLTWYRPETPAPKTVNIFGAQTYADISLGVVVNSSAPTSWCVHFR